MSINLNHPKLLKIKEDMEVQRRELNKRLSENHPAALSPEKKEEIRAVIRANPELPMHKMAKLAGVSRFSIQKILYNDFPDQLEEMRNRRHQRFIDKVWDKTEKVLDSISPKDIKKASLQQKFISFATGYDKYRLARGEPTEITETNVTDIQLIAFIQARGIDQDPEVQRLLESIRVEGKTRTISPEVQEG